jgi:hypothetical protein
MADDGPRDRHAQLADEAHAQANDLGDFSEPRQLPAPALPCWARAARGAKATRACQRISRRVRGTYFL